MELVTPYTMIISGQTGSGKTYFISQMLKHLDEIHNNKVERVILAFSMIQPLYIDLKRELGDLLEMVEGFPSDQVTELTEGSNNENTIIILDDLMIELENDQRLAMLFTKMRHKNVSTIFLVQNLYFNAKYMRTITRNAHYLTIFENPRDASMVTTLGRQIFPTHPKFLPDAFRQATLKPYGYLFLDLKPGADKKLRVREGLLPHEQAFVYLPR
jgi:hypothetical protein